MLHFNEQLRLDINTQTSPCNDVVEQPQTPNHYHIKDKVVTMSDMCMTHKCQI